MTLPPMWKVRRELHRAWIRSKVDLWLRFKNRTHVEFQGLQVPINRSGMSKGVLIQLARNDYEMPEIRGLQLAIRPGDRVLELGSGLGIITTLAAKATGPSGLVLSFEANPEMIPDTRDFIAQVGVSNVEIRHAVLVSQDSEDTTRDFHLSSSFSSSSLLGSTGHRSKGVISVPTQRVNDLIADFRPDVLICDIEGAEIEVIPALDARGIRAAVIELHPDRLSGDQIAEVHAAMARQGLDQDPVSLGGTVVMYSRATTA
ncbi:FkbM family methyltransferase [Pseudotabrizicola sp.]|uniref:FkbM family methyltransferase n=1 Tax=Pseudotabrizicola sp. TaxID=2939647 RepID=UPI0027263BD9|nr:FkbM family methyltransferase [Pseudotabrizicola sp.]MDO8884948.1 FkbM family methyltransferase [Pseudotabrizicola sp.]